MLLFQVVDISCLEQRNESCVQIFGRTKSDESVLLHVRRFRPFFYTSGLNGQGAEEFVQRRSVYGVGSAQTYVKHSFPSSVALRCAGRECKQETFEANVGIILQFMVEAGINGSSWISVSKYHRFTHPTSYCNIEADAVYTDIMLEDSVTTNFRVHSFDIEVLCRAGYFPDPQRDPIIQIGNIVSATESTEKTVFVTGGCDDIPDANVRHFSSESELLTNWLRFVTTQDADVLTGYNIDNFDIPYIMERCLLLRIPCVLGRKRREVCETRGLASAKYVSVCGRIVLDMYKIIKKEHRLRSYKLNFVASHFLNDQKEDIHHSKIPEMQNTDNSTRARLAAYCIKDALLPLNLISRLMTLINLVEMSRVTGVLINDLLNRGQQIKVFSLLLRECKQQLLIVPSEKRAPAASYQGATVFEPIKGFYEDFIVVLDFTSLYPSIMIAYNLCYSTLLDASSERTSGEVVTPCGARFSTASPGVLPTILRRLLDERVTVKAMLKTETSEEMRKVYDGRQLALKITANAVYGFTGAQTGYLPCIDISQSVTASGREILCRAKSIIDAHYPAATIVYGDTDSLMINFNSASLSEAIAEGKRAAKLVTTGLDINPIKLDFEKVYSPFLLLAKKRYVGLAYSAVSGPGKIDCRGIETVRRDNCALVPEVLNCCIQKLLVQKDLAAAIDYCKQVVQDLFENKVPLQKLVISKELLCKEYKVKQAHVELAKRLANRDANSAPSPGTRVPFVIIESGRKQPLHEKAEDPDFVATHSLPPDKEYYFKKQLLEPIKRLLGPLLTDNDREMDALLRPTNIPQRNKRKPTLLDLWIKTKQRKSPLPNGGNLI